MRTFSFTRLSLVSCAFILLCLFAACTQQPDTKTLQPPNTSMMTATASTADYAATVSGGGTVNRDNQGANLTTIHSAADRPVAKFTQTTLNVPAKARGEVFIQNDSDNPMTLVSDTPHGLPPFTIAANTTSTLVFHRAGTFKAHLKDYPRNADTTLTIVITAPNPD